MDDDRFDELDEYLRDHDDDGLDGGMFVVAFVAGAIIVAIIVVAILGTR